MNPKQLKLIAIALAVALSLWGLSELLSGRSDDAETALVIPALQITDVDTVAFVSETDTVVLARSGDEWTVNGFRASFEEVDEFFAALSDSSEAELVATGTTVHQRMEVDEESGTQLRLVDGSMVLSHTVIGKAGRRYNSRYVRLADSDPVYLYVGPMSRFVSREVDDWRDKRILDIEPDSIEMVAVQRGGERYTLMRGPQGWTFATGSPADSAAVSRVLSQYVSVDASGFASEAQADSADFTGPDRTVTLVGQPGDTLASLLFDSTASAFWVQKRSGGTIYRILQWKANQMMPAESTLVAEQGG
jgi:hypothetical protein